MAFNDVLDAGHLLQRVDVLRVVAQQSALLFEGSDESMGRRRVELAGIDFTGEFVKRSWIVGEVADVEH